MYLGIDLGTTNSAVAGVVDGKLRLFKTADGADVLPSVIYVDKRGHRLYGKRAYEQAALSPENVARGFKRLMGTSTEIEFKAAGIKTTPEDCSAEILRQLIGQAVVESGVFEIEGTVITIPAAFNQMQSEATLRAAKTAGLERVALLQEPIAAAMAAMASAKNRSGQFLVYDLGGGTFDLALVQSVSGTVSVIGHVGINMLGGQDFDRAIVNGIIRPWLLEHFALPTDFQKHERYRRITGLAHFAAEQAKIELSSKDAATVVVPDDYARIVDDAGHDVYVDIPITRADLDGLVTDRIEETVVLARRLLKDNGYSSGDIDRIVPIGGPSKMPCVRDRVPRELGIPADLSTDPMTAVAIGAAIFCESRKWGEGSSTRKAARASVAAEGVPDVRYDYPARTSDDTIVVRLRTGSAAVGHTVQIDAPTGWTSGRVEVADASQIKVPVGDVGENVLRATLFDSSGKPAGSTLLTVVRAYASAAGIPATQTICVKVRGDATSTRNVLDPLVAKGTVLPASGVKEFVAAHDLDPAVPGFIDLEMFQDEGAAEPELNLSVGAFRVAHNDLPDGTKVRKGDKVVVHWCMDESGLLNASVELPSVGQIFETRRFYVDQAGNRSFEGEEGTKLADAVLGLAHQELVALREAAGGMVTEEAKELQVRLAHQEQALEYAASADEQRSITEEGRHIRQRISRLKSLPENRGKVMEAELAELVGHYSEIVREFADAASNRRFDELAESCRSELGRQTPKTLDAAAIALCEMQAIHSRNLWRNPGFVVYMFNSLTEERHMSADKAAFDLLIREGAEALKENDVDRLRRIVSALLDVRIQVGGAPAIDRLASVFRG
jgi:molecular chaperone DnaK